MSKLGLNFVEHWIDKNVSYAGTGRNSIVAMELAARCRDAAVSQGITIEIPPQFDTLENIIYEAMDHPVRITTG